MRCNDPAITYLKQHGYNVIRLPRADIHPLEMVVSANGRFERIGSLSTAITSSISAPTFKQDITCAGVSGQRTGSLRLGIGLAMLNDIVAAMGGSSFDVSAEFHGVKRISFEFIDVLEDSIDIAELDQYLAAGEVNPLSRHVGHLLDRDDICVIASVIKSARLLVRSNGERNAQATLGEASRGTLKLKTLSSDTILFEGPHPLVFGCKAVRLQYDDGQYRAFSHIAPGTKPFSTGQGSAPQYEIAAPAFIRFE